VIASEGIGADLTQAQLALGLRSLGLGEGDVAMLHSLLGAFGHVLGGAEAVVKAFITVLGSNGTLVAPTFVDCFEGGPEQVWDRDNTPSRMGAISECLRTWPGARRGRNATHPLAALGPVAPDLTERDNVTAWGYDSAFQRLIELNAWVVLAGVGWNTRTLVHLLEERAEVPYRYWAERSGAVVERGVSRRMTFRCLNRQPGVSYDFEPLGALLEQQGPVRSERIGHSLVRAVRARDLFDVGYAALRRDPLFLVSAETREVARDYLPDYGALLDDYGRRRQAFLRPEQPVARRLATVLRVPKVKDVRCEPRNHWKTDDGLVLEELRFEGGPNAFVPALLARPARVTGRRPAVICLHGTGGTCEREMEPRLLERGSTLLGWARATRRLGRRRV